MSRNTFNKLSDAKALLDLAVAGDSVAQKNIADNWSSQELSSLTLQAVLELASSGGVSSGSSEGGTSGNTQIQPKRIRRRRKSYVSAASDQTFDLDDEVGISGGKVKSYAVNLIANGEPQKTVRLTNSLNERDNFGASLQGVFLNDLGENEYVSEIGSLFLKATDLNNRNIVELTWSEEV